MATVPLPSPWRRRGAALRVWLAGSYRELLGLVARSRVAGVAFVGLLGLMLAALALMAANAVLVRFLPDVRPKPLAPAARPEAAKNFQVVAESPADRALWRRIVVIPKKADKPAPDPYPTVAEVAVVEERAGGAYTVKVELYYRATPHELKDVKWWTSGGLARSNAVLDIRPHSRFGLFMYALDFPTSEQALASYMRSYWSREVADLNGAYKSDRTLVVTDEEMNRQIAGGLEKAFGRDLEDARTHWAVVSLRIINGPIQWVTIAAFVALLQIIWARWQVFVRAEHHNELRARRPTPGQRQGPNFVKWLKHELREVDRRDEQHLARWGNRSICWTIWGQSLRAAERSAVAAEAAKANAADAAVEAARESGDIEQAELDSRGFNLRYLIGALPALGFIGTVWGIADALMNVGGVLSAELAKQQSGIGAVALALSVAFDTTLVALLLALVGGFLAASLTAAEEGVVLASRRACQENICPTTHPSGGHPPPGPTGAAPPPAPARPPAPPVMLTKAPAAPPAPTLADGPDHYARAAVRPPWLPWAALYAVAVGVVAYGLFVLARSG